MKMLRAGFTMLLGGLVLASAVVILLRMVASSPEPLEPRAGGLNPVPDPPEGPLSGLVVYLSAGHGYLLHRVRHDGEPFAWGQQRRRRYGMVEDEWTADFVADDLAPAIEAQGGTVIALRERDRNPLMAISDDEEDSSFGAEIANRVRSDLAQYGSYSRLEPNGKMVWWVSVPHDSHWYLYARWVDAPDLDPQAIYTVSTGAEVREVVVDQRSHGGHWWPLGDFCLMAGDLVEVTLSGSGKGMLSGDAIRLGGGNFVFAPPFDFKVREHTMYEVAMPHQVEHLGTPPDLPYYECGNPISDMRLRPIWASWAHPEDEEAVYLSIHTNAAPRGRAEGLTVFAGIDRGARLAAFPESVRLAELLEERIYHRVQEHDRRYRTRGARLGDYSEISPAYNELPGALLELGFHDNPREVRRLLSQQFKDDAAAAIVEALEAWRAAPAVADGLTPD